MKYFVKRIISKSLNKIALNKLGYKKIFFSNKKMLFKG